MLSRIAKARGEEREQFLAEFAAKHPIEDTEGGSQTFRRHSLREFPDVFLFLLLRRFSLKNMLLASRGKAVK